jgi:hypothetical protein
MIKDLGKESTYHYEHHKFYPDLFITRVQNIGDRGER